MIKTETTQIVKEQIVHKFYCDKCGKFLGETIECDDGYYKQIRKCELSLLVGSRWFRKDQTLCEDCEIKDLAELEVAIEKLGFQSDSSMESH